MRTSESRATEIRWTQGPCIQIHGKEKKIQPNLGEMGLIGCANYLVCRFWISTKI